MGGQASGSVQTGGWNGGGNGGTSYGGGGGGASDIRIGGTALTNRVVVAGGGGGNGYSYTTSNGGTGGGLTGGNGFYNNTYSASYCGSGGSQMQEERQRTYSTYLQQWLNWYRRKPKYSIGGGGGGGYYGGGGGSYYGGGGGGSSWTDPVLAANVTHTQAYQSGNGQILISYTVQQCVSTTRTSVSVIVSTLSVPTAVTATPSTVNCGSSTNLSAFTTGSCVRWWDSPSGGNLIGTSSNGAGFTITPTTVSTYYAESFQTPCYSPRVPITVFYNTIPAPSSVTASPDTLSCGAGTNISATTTSGIVRWWDAASGGNLIATGQSGIFLSITPLVSTTYYAETYNYNAFSQTFSYTGSSQTFTVPAGVNNVTADVQGASGGTYNITAGVGGPGGRVTANLSVTPGQILFLNIGGQGTWSSSSPYGAGWNGGGSGGYSSYYGGGGGGASDIRIGGTGLSNRVIVAAGGGGGCGNTSYYNGNGGIGGDQTGGYGLWFGCFLSSYCGMGGSQTLGGMGASSGGASGTLGIGGNAYASYGGGGGGGGYYGGGGGYEEGGGGGGSNYYSSTGTSNVVTYQGTISGNGQIVINWNIIGCVSTSRTPISVIINPISSQLSNVTATPSTISCGGTSSLNATLSGYTIGWFNASSGGTRLSTSLSGTNDPVTPTSTMTYYAEAENTVSGSLTFSYTGAVQSFVVPINTTALGLDVQGAQGGTYSGSNGTGGMGGRVQATLCCDTRSEIIFLCRTAGNILFILFGLTCF